MSTLLRLAPALLLLVVGLSACGDDDAGDGDPASTTAPATTAAPSATVTPTTEPPATSTTAAATTTTTTTPPTTEPVDDRTTIEITIREGEVTGGGRREVVLGSELRIVVDADVADEIHVHGYDVFGAVAPGTPAVLEMTADIPGVFEVELEGAHTEILELEVAP
jgi:hypothetical protein